VTPKIRVMPRRRTTPKKRAMPRSALCLLDLSSSARVEAAAEEMPVTG
jgi:hypothetical protein